MSLRILTSRESSGWASSVEREPGHLASSQAVSCNLEREGEREGGGGGPYVCMCNLQVISTLHMGIRSFNY